MNRMTREQQLSKFARMKRLLQDRNGRSNKEIAFAAGISLPTFYNWSVRVEAPGTVGGRGRDKVPRRPNFATRAVVPKHIATLRDELTSAFNSGDLETWRQRSQALRAALAALPGTTAFAQAAE